MDLLNGLVVHGIGGKRDEYKPIDNSVITTSAYPLEVARDFQMRLGLARFYIADLNLIQETIRKDINVSRIRELVLNSNFKLMVDGGCTNLNDVIRILELGVHNVIIGTETLNSLNFIEKCVNTFGENKIIVSIDQKEGKVLSKSQTITSLDAISFAKKLEDFGVRQTILLDLDRVGTENGSNITPIRNIIEKTELKVIVGGGIRNLQELQELSSVGVSATLLATILHNGKVTVEDLKSAGFL